MPAHGAPPTPGPTRLVLRVPAHPGSVRIAREALRSLTGVVGDAVIARAELVVSELVTNAIRHGSDRDDDVVLRLTVDGTGIIGAVSDHGPSFEPPRDWPELSTPGGFGLHIVAELATAWSVDRSEAGNDVRFVLSA